ncbi:MAG: PHP domain-containing protein, partial [Vallitaleaceae bacterium]|nr:PHP domain-containing protein [Vallitaleaceae bacterium]
MKADLHLHTHYSDGSDTPREIFRLARKNEVRLISITDHDTLEGRDEFRKLSNEFHVDYIPGVEVSAYDYERNRPCHIIGLNVQSGCKEFEQMI